DEGVGAAGAGQVDVAERGRAREQPGDVNMAHPVHRDAGTRVEPGATQALGPKEITRTIQLGDEGVGAAGAGQVDVAERGRAGESASDIDVPCPVDCDTCAVV